MAILEKEMTNKLITDGSSLPNIPWEDKPAGYRDVVWRSSRNPIIKRDALPNSNSIFNSAVVPFQGKFAGVFRVDNKARDMRIHAGFSDDAINWKIDPEPLHLINEDLELESEYQYDPRVCWVEDRFYVTWCNGYHGPTIGCAWTKDFRQFFQLENAYLPYNRNGVMFPKKINGNFAMLSRPSDTGHTAFGDMFYSESPDMEFWGRHRWVMKPTEGWQHKKVGAGPIPIETKDGWLLIYHGVLNSCNGFVYSFASALLDLEKPWKVIKRNRTALLRPTELYECVGDVPNVAFPCAMLHDAPTGRLTIYYGGADTVVCMAHAYVDELIDFLKKDSMI